MSLLQGLFINTHTLMVDCFLLSFDILGTSLEIVCLQIVALHAWNEEWSVVEQVVPGVGLVSCG